MTRLSANRAIIIVRLHKGIGSESMLHGRGTGIVVVGAGQVDTQSSTDNTANLSIETTLHSELVLLVALEMAFLAQIAKTYMIVNLVAATADG